MHMSNMSSLFQIDFTLQENVSAGDEFDKQDIPRGPFGETKFFYKALILALFIHLKELPMEHHFFHAPVPVPPKYNNFQECKIATDRCNDYAAIGPKAESAKNRLGYALVGISLEDDAPVLAEKDNRIKCRTFPLCHLDLSC